MQVHVDGHDGVSGKPVGWNVDSVSGQSVQRDFDVFQASQLCGMLTVVLISEMLPTIRVSTVKECNLTCAG